MVTLASGLGQGLAQQAGQSQTGTSAPVVQPKETAPTIAPKPAVEVPKAPAESMKKEVPPAPSGAEVKSGQTSTVKEAPVQARAEPPAYDRFERRVLAM